jgi:tRNA A37 threonylcarbamoyladenosine synthetase subunit TsaC/SUA5/YrdC
MNLRYQRSQPLLPLDPTLKQRAISVATRLMTEFTKGGKYRVPVAKYAQEICKIYRIPLLPKEAPVTVAVKKLEQWRAQVNFRAVADADIEAVLPELESLVKTIRLAIDSKIITRKQRKKANASRYPRHCNMPSTRPLDLPEGDPYGD